MIDQTAKPMVQQKPHLRLNSNRLDAVVNSTLVGRGLLFGMAAVLPLDHHLPRVGPFGAVWFFFALLGLYALAIKTPQLIRASIHPIMLSLLAFLVVVSIMETTHRITDYTDIIRCSEMAIGCAFVGAICQDYRAIRALLAGIVIGGFWLSVLLIFGSYGALSDANTAGFQGASQLRTRAFADQMIQGNLNSFAFLAGCSAVISFAAVLKSKDRRHQVVIGAIGLCCAIGAMLPMSRSGIVILAFSCLAVLIANRPTFGQIVGLLVVGLIVFSIWIPKAVFERMSISIETRYSSGALDARSRVYNAALERVSDYMPFGVGVGTYWEHWAAEKGFSSGDGAIAPHSVFLSSAIFWGVPGLSMLLFLLVVTWRYVPRPVSANAELLCLFGFTIATFFALFIKNEFYSKQYCFILGSFVGLNTLYKTKPRFTALRP